MSDFNIAKNTLKIALNKTAQDTIIPPAFREIIQEQTKGGKADLERAIEIAVKAHAKQKRRDGSPHVLHSMRIMLKAWETSENAAIVAILHDIDDTSVNISELKRDGFNDEVIQALELLTKKDVYSYQNLSAIKANEIAKQVKMLEIADNLSLTELATEDQKDIDRINKYKRTYQFLRSK